MKLTKKTRVTKLNLFKDETHRTKPTVYLANQKTYRNTNVVLKTFVAMSWVTTFIFR